MEGRGEGETPLNTEFRIRGKEGISRWFKTRLVPIRDEGGLLVKWYGTCTDIDDLRQAAEARHAAEAPKGSKDSRRTTTITATKPTERRVVGGLNRGRSAFFVRIRVARGHLIIV